MELRYIIEDKYNDKDLRHVMLNEFGMSNNMIKKIKLYGTLEVNGVHRRVIDNVKSGDVVYAAYSDDAGCLNKVSEIPIYYEDEWIAICEKPSGIVTHPSHGHLEDSLLTRLSTNTLHPVMRLDRETSGLIAIAKNGHAHSQVVKNVMSKRYVAIVYGRYNPTEGTIDKPIARRPNSVMIREINTQGHPSITHYKELYYDSNNNISLVEFVLVTGRCHQIRVHSLSENHPLVGDGLYGPNSIDNPMSIEGSIELDNKIGRQALHAYFLEITHPITKEKMRFKSPIPNDMMNLFSSSAQEAIKNIQL